MTKRNLKKLLIFLEQLNNLLDEKLDIFFNERLFLENLPSKPKILNLKERSNQNELKIKKIIGTINGTLALEVSIHTPKKEQSTVF